MEIKLPCVSLKTVRWTVASSGRGSPIKCAERAPNGFVGQTPLDPKLDLGCQVSGSPNPVEIRDHDPDNPAGHVPPCLPGCLERDSADVVSGKSEVYIDMAS